MDDPGTAAWLSRQMSCQESRHKYSHEVIDAATQDAVASLLTKRDAALIAVAPDLERVVRRLLAAVTAYETVELNEARDEANAVLAAIREARI